MFESLNPLVADPILGLMAAYRSDANTRKVDLGVGVYKDESGTTPILATVKDAERRLLDAQDTKSYVGPAGSAQFNQLSRELLLGEQFSDYGRVVTIQTPGGCGALRAGAELIRRSKPDAVIWVSDPTWANHIPLLGSARLEIKSYPYYDYENKGLRFDAMMETLTRAGEGDVVLLHGCCHNPCGADMDSDQWSALAELIQAKGLVPFVDVAYQGFGSGIEEDVAGLRCLANAVPEMLIANSCSKNFGLYRERTGSLTVIARARDQVDIAGSQVCSVVRAIWSMPPDHGASVVAHILGDRELRASWVAEVACMRERINGLRRQLVAGLAAAGAGDFGFIARERGMFSFLGLSPDQVKRLQREFSIYLVDSSRINVAGLNAGNMDYVCDAVSVVMN